eukprot:1662615-Rhodomonas_salina.1
MPPCVTQRRVLPTSTRPDAPFSSPHVPHSFSLSPSLSSLPSVLPHREPQLIACSALPAARSGMRLASVSALLPSALIPRQPGIRTAPCSAHGTARS